MIKLTLISTLGITSISACLAKCDHFAERLVNAYPDHLLACKDNHIIWRDGLKQLYDDGIDKDFRQLIESPDIQDMFAFAYRTDVSSYQVKPKQNKDPGRIRNSCFFKRMYNETKSDVNRQLTSVRWMPKSSKRKVTVSTVNQIDQKLQHISTELDALPKHLKNMSPNTLALLIGVILAAQIV